MPNSLVQDVSEQNHDAFDGALCQRAATSIFECYALGSQPLVMEGLFQSSQPIPAYQQPSDKPNLEALAQSCGILLQGGNGG